MKLEFGDGTDNDTWDNIFRHIAENGYVVEVNGIDIQLTGTYQVDGTSGLAGFLWDNKAGKGDITNRVEFGWDEIEKVVVY